MKLAILTNKAKDVGEITLEITVNAFYGFVSTFTYFKPNSSGPGLNSDSTIDSDVCPSDSDLSDFDSSVYGCGEITESIENMVANNVEICTPLDEVYGPAASEIIKTTIKTVTEESQCAALNVFNELTSDITTNEDYNLIKTCITVCYWCCCETIKKLSPIIAEATITLISS